MPQDLTNRRTAYLRQHFDLSLNDVKERAKEHNVSKNDYYKILDQLVVQKKVDKKKATNKKRYQKVKTTKQLKEELKNFNVDEQPYIRRVDPKENITEGVSKTFKNSGIDFSFYNNNENSGEHSFSIVGKAAPKIIETLLRLKNVKVWFSFNIEFYRLRSEEYVNYPHTLRDSRPITNASQVRGLIQQIKADLRDAIENIQLKGTDLVFNNIKSMKLGIVRYSPLQGGSYLPLPDFIAKKKCCINIKNKDEKCLMYCILYHIHQKDIPKHFDRITKYEPYLNEFDWSKVKFPVKLSQIDKIEELVGYPINIYGWDNEVVVLRISKKQGDGINLLMITDPNNKSRIEHYVYIKKLDVLISKKQRDEDGNHATKTKYLCPNCLHPFSTKERLKKHRIGGCDMFKPVKTVYPKMIHNEDGTWSKPIIQFKNFNKSIKAPVVIYADFETFVQKTNTKHDDTKSSTSLLAELPPNSYAFNVVSDYPELNLGLYEFRGENCMKLFLKKLLDVGDKIRGVLDIENEMIITKTQEKEFQKCKKCHICDCEFQNDDVKVRDHDHITGLYRGCAHQSCNINLNYKNYKVPVYFHNLKGFDGHLIIQGLKEMNFSKVDIIAQNFEKYMTISFGVFRIYDSFAFLSSSLDVLSSNLLKDGIGNFKHTIKNDSSDKQKELIVKKGVYPYEYIDSFEKFEETELPSKEMFYSSLTEDHISDADYAHAQNVWNVFKCKNIGEYHDLYLKTDVLLLTDVFEAFRKTAMKNYGLDPSNGYITLPNYAWDVMLKMTKVNLEQLTDPDMYLMCEQGIRGGISMISHRYAKANNKYLDDYDDKLPNSYIIYLDANNLYGYAMIRKLPYGGFEWVNNVDVNYVKNFDSNGEDGIFVKCDIQYPEELHDLHNEYPLAPESRVITKEELSPYQVNQIVIHKEKHNDKIKKLVPNLYHKKEYVCHIKNLQYYIGKGLKITKIHNVLKFKQSNWLEPYINFNTEMRKQSKNEFEKDLYKLMNNAVFGKTMENVRARVNIKLCTDDKELVRTANKPQFEQSKIYSESLIAVKSSKKEVELNKPIYVGLSVLDLSKLHMYEFHYDYIKVKYADKAKLLFTDTDSLCYRIETDDIYKDMDDDKHLFDRSDYAQDGYRIQDNTNKKVIGKFKDETCGVPIREFIGLRSKMYSILLDNGKEKKTGKGIKKSAMKKLIKHEDYKRCLFSSEIDDQRQKVSFNNLRSVDHKIGLYRYTKVGLSCSNDKQYLLNDGIKSYSYGHYRINAELL